MREYRQRGGKRSPSGLSREEYLKRYREENRERLTAQARKQRYCEKYVVANPEAHILSRAKQAAKKAGVAFNLDKSDIVIPTHCPILKIPIYRNIGGKGMSPNSISIDRIIPELGYVKGNIQIISQRANVMKNDASVEELELFANWVLNQLIPSLRTSTVY